MLTDVHIVIPVFDDWGSVPLLLSRIGKTLAIPPAVLLVDDGSSAPVPADLGQGLRSLVRSVEILHLRRNLGHQRAIAVGLMHLLANVRGDAVVVMDADGEDLPEHVAVLLDHLQRTDQAAVFAARSRRLEGAIFRFFYALYLFAHRVLVGRHVRMGNFSALRWDLLRTLGVTPELWNHYAAAVCRTGARIGTIPLPRGQRLHGSSRMSFAALVAHGLSAISVFGDIVAVRLLTGVTAVCVAGGAAAASIVACVLTGVWVPPAGATLALTALGLFLGHAVLICFVLAFLLLNGRSQLSTVPERNCLCFVDHVEELHLTDV
jgi:polyisoprenyl-phosphate glycosyltransferase